MFKKFLFIFIAACSFGTAFAFKPDSLVEAGNKHYVSNDFMKAAQNWQTVIDSGYAAPELYYNLGNSYYKMNNYARAILNYERALLLAPNNKDIKFNLKLANAHVVDKIDNIPDFFLKRWIHNLTKIFTSNNWAIISIAAFMLFLVLFIMYLFSSKLWIKQFTFYFFIISFIISVTAFIFSSRRKKMIVERNSAIIMAPSVTVKSSPNEYGTNLFVLHEGTKVVTVDSVGVWNEIKISNGNKGWVKNSTFERI